MASPSSSVSQASSSSVASIFPFSSSLTPLSLKLDSKNYLYWRSQILTTTHAYNLKGFLIGTTPRFNLYNQHLNPNGSENLIQFLNLEFQLWLHHDQFLMSWLFSSVSE
ncbi:hypothetical protein TorRG33x02_206510 [Trema orientale]|uniref:Retrotransposon Copia-like N-terminal domain-containing protein n=1 Tax=Trema orientale TaxID=63057 RepID=A0A2P5ED61_TREOI|nr:hypothetical protein TorRG33x02_206510 [Trema orientale]